MYMLLSHDDARHEDRAPAPCATPDVTREARRSAIRGCAYVMSRVRSALLTASDLVWTCSFS
jgi:hypothetical protein